MARRKKHKTAENALESPVVLKFFLCFAGNRSPHEGVLICATIALFWHTETKIGNHNPSQMNTPRTSREDSHAFAKGGHGSHACLTAWRTI